MVPLPSLPLIEKRGFIDPAPAQQITAKQREVLNHFRLAAMACRVSARTDLFEACALLSLDGEDARRTFVDTFIKCLSGAVQRKTTWFVPGAVEVSFDEAWVMRCLSSIWNNDTSSLDFLLKSRVGVADRRYIGFLLGRISEQFSQN
ncbi:MAG: hypothetical protein WBB25_14585 [Sulfitobacter sp.]